MSFEGYEGYQIIGMHGWILEVNGEITKLSFGTALTNCAAIYIGDKNVAIVKKIAKINHYCEVQAEPMIASEFVAMFNKNYLPDTEFYHAAFQGRPNSINLPYFDLIAFFLCKPNLKMKLFDLSLIPSDRDIEIDRDIDRSYLIPDIVFFKDSMEFIDEYIGHLYPNITKHIDSVLSPQIINRLKEQLATPQPNVSQPTQPVTPPQPTPQEQISSLKEEINKKDKAIKEFSDKLSLQEANLKSTNESLLKKDLEIKNLEITSQKAQNIKNHLSLGNAFIKAHKSWYKGGYIKFIFEAIKIKKEHKNRTK
ncbi:hypothetical protein YZ82_06815 [Campylobacter hyointestinalis]|uniref:Uncharacterized protein n=1 Tax=Campylobacter hyointestinalis TaxID=198 RepID=A0A562XDW8_CAMHY|nr:hypothetical protein YZ82_06815 [Campylobacter hyointestinalis]